MIGNASIQAKAKWCEEEKEYERRKKGKGGKMSWHHNKIS
jgi:hypothetical protein